ncbi:hypothetical protein T492DRAFT_879676, partial [Pavlovales sp. CCMP2436]
MSGATWLALAVLASASLAAGPPPGRIFASLPSKLGDPRFVATSLPGGGFAWHAATLPDPPTETGLLRRRLLGQPPWTLIRVPGVPMEYIETALRQAGLIAPEPATGGCLVAGAGADEPVRGTIVFVDNPVCRNASARTLSRAGFANATHIYLEKKKAIEGLAARYGLPTLRISYPSAKKSAHSSGNETAVPSAEQS